MKDSWLSWVFTEMKPKCPLCHRRCRNKLCEKVLSYHGVYTKEGLEVTEAGKRLYKKLKWQRKN